ncbi:MAG: acireductone synthase [Chitinophagaceae bacterium]|nr:acireductone synthase [Oligoflexus sp.]
MIRCVLTDIEGTTSSIEFVHKVLFPYARSHLAAFLTSNQDPDVRVIVQKIWQEELHGSSSSEPDLQAVTTLLQQWIDKDIKNGSLKILQGKIWRDGYETKAYLGHVYPDVLPQLQKWHKQGLRLAVYSSGSVEAQKLIYKHSESGDLTPYFTANFDTEIGHKRQTSSYRTIVNRLDLEADSILFLSDIKEELDAAAEAGMKTCQLLRDPLPIEGRHPKAKNFAEVGILIR